MFIVTYLEPVSFTPSVYIKSSRNWGWRFGQHLGGSSIHSPERMKQLGTWAIAWVIDTPSGMSPTFCLPVQTRSHSKWGRMALSIYLGNSPKTVCVASFLILISHVCFLPRMIAARATAGQWTFGQLGLVTWQRPDSEKQWWWGPLSCWPSLWKPLRNHALQTKQVCPGASPFSWKERFPEASLRKAQSSVLILLYKWIM